MTVDITKKKTHSLVTNALERRSQARFLKHILEHLGAFKDSHLAHTLNQHRALVLGQKHKCCDW